MAEKTILARHDGGMRFTMRTGSGHTIVADNETGDSAPRPTELVAAALAACGGMDVVSILDKKHQVVTSYEIRVRAIQREEHPHSYERIELTHEVVGPELDVEAVRRAIELSATRYCSVNGNLSSGLAEVHHRYLVRRGSPEAPEVLQGEVLVTGPGMAFGSTGP